MPSLIPQTTLNDNGDILNELQTSLKKLLREQRDRAPDCDVIWYDDLREHLTERTLLQIFINCHGAKHLVKNIRPSGNVDPKSHRIKIVGILILIGFSQWDLFEDIFLKSSPGRERNDGELPFTMEEMQDQGLFRQCSNDRLASDFYDQQFRFLPIKIWNPTKKPYSKLHRLPFCSKEIRRGGGASGEVYKRVIRRAYLQKWDSSSVEADEKDEKVCAMIWTQ